MSSKNNPEARGKVTELRKYNGKPVKPAALRALLRLRERAVGLSA